MRADPDTEREVMASLEEMFHLYGVGDIDGCMARLVADDDVTLMEPANHQFWIGRDAVRAGIQLDYDTTEGEIPIRITTRHVSRSGDVAWVNGELELAINYHGRNIVLEDNRFTAIARKEDGRWLWHTVSIGLMDPEQSPDQPWKDYTITERLAAARKN
jgi:ketosteroid isomerase-like protein